MLSDFPVHFDVHVVYTDIQLCPLVADLFLFCYEGDIMGSLSNEK